MSEFEFQAFLFVFLSPPPYLGHCPQIFLFFDYDASPYLNSFSKAFLSIPSKLRVLIRLVTSVSSGNYFRYGIMLLYVGLVSVVIGNVVCIQSFI